MHAWPRSTRSLVTVFRATPVMREVERMLFPSTRAATTLTRSSFVSAFIMSIMLEQMEGVKKKMNKMLDTNFGNLLGFTCYAGRAEQVIPILWCCFPSLGNRLTFF